jgi:hypothetical protein
MNSMIVAWPFFLTLILYQGIAYQKPSATLDNLASILLTIGVAGDSTFLLLADKRWNSAAKHLLKRITRQ